MKLNEVILLEIREVLDRYSHYGAWIDAANKKVYPIDGQGGHADFIKARLDKFGIPQQFIQSMNDYYTIGFSHNLVRVVHKPSSTIWVQGTPEDLKMVGRIIFASAVQDDIDQVVLSIVQDPNNIQSTKEQVFQMPTQRQQLQSAIT